jgi:hypothetical protein
LGANFVALRISFSSVDNQFCSLTSNDLTKVPFKATIVECDFFIMTILGHDDEEGFPDFCPNRT